MATRIEFNTRELRKFLHNPELEAELMQRGNAGVDYAQSIAPVGDAAHDINSGEYRDSLKAEAHYSESRVSVRVGTDDYKRYWIEFGAAHMPKYRVLGKTMDHVKG